MRITTTTNSFCTSMTSDFTIILRTEINIVRTTYYERLVYFQCFKFLKR